MNKIVVVSEYFDSLHVGYLENISLAKQFGKKLIIIVNNDKQATLRKGAIGIAERFQRGKSMGNLILRL